MLSQIVKIEFNQKILINVITINMLLYNKKVLYR